MDCNRCSPRYLWGEPKMHVIVAVMRAYVTFFPHIGARMRMFILIIIRALHEATVLHRKLRNGNLLIIRDIPDDFSIKRFPFPPTQTTKSAPCKRFLRLMDAMNNHARMPHPEVILAASVTPSAMALIKPGRLAEVYLAASAARCTPPKRGADNAAKSSCIFL